MNKDRKMRTIPIVFAMSYLLLMVFSSLAISADSPLVQELKYYYFTEKGDKVEIKMATDAKAERIAVDSKGNLYVTDPIEQAVDVFNSNARHIKRIRSLHRPIGIAASGAGEDRTIYVGGYLNGGHVVALLNQSGSVKDFLGMGAVKGIFADISIDTKGDVYLLDCNSFKIKVFDKNGVPTKEYSPNLIRRESEDLTISGIKSTVNGVVSYVTKTANYLRTLHSIDSPGGIAISEDRREIYVSGKEVVSYLSDQCLTGNCYTDAEAYLKYASTGAEFKYFVPLADRYRVFVIDMDTGDLKDTLVDLSGGFINSGYTNAPFVLPQGLAVDDKGRLYVATTSGIKVFDQSTGSAVGVSGFGQGAYLDIAFVQSTAGSGGLLYATSGNKVTVYSIDNSSPPANNPPGAPALISPASGAYVNNLTPTFIVASATDADADPLTYGYDAYEAKNTGEAILVATASGISEGANGKTSMVVTSPLKENTRYRWRAQSFDGNAATWSDFSEFCVNEKNDNPSIPEVVGPKDMAAVSPFSSSLTWNPSTDLDCYDAVSYIVQVSEDPGFETILTAVNEHTTSIRIDKLSSLLRKGVSYYWRVKAVDGHSGESAFSSGSFIYKNTAVTFTSDQPETTVYIDGNYGYFGRALGRTPVSVEGISPGPHFVTFVKGGHYDGKGNYKPGYEPYHTIINIADPLVDTSTEVYAEMRLAGKILPSSASDELMNLESGMSSPFVVDYNNDGLKELVVGGKDGKVYLYLAEEQLQPDGTKKVVLTPKGALRADEIDINVSSMAVPFVVDYNNDGKKDLLVGSGDGLIYLYLNTGQEEAPVFAASGTLKDRKGNDITAGANAAPAVVDYNNDGKKDIVIGSYDGTLKVYLNVGSDEVPEFDPSSSAVAVIVDGNFLDVGSNSKAFFTDWNSDGKKDLVVGRGVTDHEGNTLNLFLNVGTDSDPSFISIPALRKWTAGKRRERGNRESVPYLGYNRDLGDLTGGGNGTPFVVDWNGSSARDVIVGRGDGKVVTFISK